MTSSVLNGNATLVFQPAPDRPPPLQTVGMIRWLKANLFSSGFNSLLTVLAVFFLYKTVPPLVSWVLIDATWVGGKAACGGDSGACWPFIFNKFRVLMVGVYPDEHLFRPIIAGVLFVTLAVVSLLHLVRFKKVIVLWCILPIVALWLINGGFGLKTVDQSLWGGLMLSIGLSFVGILFSIPLGILLALGRYSNAPAAKALCVGIIETVRGVPLITILFMASVMMPLFLPEGLNINNLLRVQVGMILFSSAYMAEVVRGGLQAVPTGQYEAAKSMGVGYWVMTLLVILPQALRHVIPSLINRCVALFMDTSLVVIIGLLDFLGMIKASAQDPEWLGHHAEAYVFCAFVYWAICFSMSRYGRSLEHRQSN